MHTISSRLLLESLWVTRFINFMLTISTLIFIVTITGDIVMNYNQEASDARPQAPLTHWCFVELLYVYFSMLCSILKLFPLCHMRFACLLKNFTCYSACKKYFYTALRKTNLEDCTNSTLVLPATFPLVFVHTMSTRGILVWGESFHHRIVVTGS